MTKQNKYILSYGGGVNSSSLYFYIVHIKKLPLDLVIMADTGEESRQTIETAERMKAQCEKDEIKFVLVKSKFGRMVDYYTNKKAIPSLVKRDCTSKFKISPIRKYYRENYDKKTTQIKQYIGITIDESHRVTTSDVKYMDYIYPYVEDRITRKQNEEILKQFNFKASKSGCLGCFYQSKDSWIEFVKNNYEEFKRWQNMEENNKYYHRTFKYVDEYQETENLILCEDEDGEQIYRRERKPTGKKIKVPAKPLYLNGKYSLKQIENFIKYQKSLSKWINTNTGDLTCPNTHGGCFL